MSHNRVHAGSPVPKLSRYGSLARLAELPPSFGTGPSSFVRAAQLLQETLGRGAVCSIWGAHECHPGGEGRQYLGRLAMALPDNTEPSRPQRITVLPMDESLSGRALAEGEPYRHPDVLKCQHFADRDAALKYDLGSITVVPMYWPDSKEMGTVAVLLPRGQSLDPSDDEFLIAFSKVLASSIGSWKFTVAHEAHALATSALEAATAESRHSLDQFCVRFRDLVGAEAVSVFLADEQRSDIRAGGSTGFQDARLDYSNIRYALGEGLTGLVAQTGRRVWCVLDEKRQPLATGYPEQPWKKKYPERAPGQKYRYRAFLVVPLIHRGYSQDPLGVLRVGISKDGYAFSKVVLDAAEKAADAIAGLVAEHRTEIRHGHVLEAAIRLAECKEPGAVLDMTVASAIDLLPDASSGAMVALSAGESDFRFLVYHPKKFEAEARTRRLPNHPDRSLPGRAHHTKDAFVHSDMQDSTIVPTADPINPASRACLVVPLHTTHRPDLVLLVDSPKRDVFDEIDQQTLKLFARIAGHVIDNQRLLQHQRSFLRMMGHQFGAPAIALRNFTNQLVGVIETEAAISQRPGLARASSLAAGLEAQATITAHVAQNLSTVFRFFELDDERARRELRLRRHALLPYVIGNVRMYQAYALATKGLKIEVLTDTFDEEWCIAMDERLMDQVMWNLLDNAIKYSVSESTISISGAREGDTYAVRMTNRGLPVRAGETDRVFEEQWRSPLAERVAPVGTGIGLSLARRIVQLHHGDLSVAPSREPEPGTPGFLTMFTIQFPRMKGGGH